MIYEALVEDAEIELRQLSEALGLAVQSGDASISIATTHRRTISAQRGSPAAPPPKRLTSGAHSSRGSGPLLPRLAPRSTIGTPRRKRKHDLFRGSGGRQETVFGRYDVTREEVIEFATQIRPAAVPLVRRGSRQDPFRADRRDGLAHHGDDDGGDRARMLSRRTGRSRIAGNRRIALAEAGLSWRRCMSAARSSTRRRRAVEARHRQLSAPRPLVTNQDGVDVMRFTSIVLIRAAGRKRNRRARFPDDTLLGLGPARLRPGS